MTLSDGDRVNLERIRMFCDQIKGDVDHFGNDPTTFSSQPVFQRVVCFKIIQIGDLAGMLSAEARSSIDLDWDHISRLGVIVTAKNLDNDLDGIWDIISGTIPAIRSACDVAL